MSTPPGSRGPRTRPVGWTTAAALAARGAVGSRAAAASTLLVALGVAVGVAVLLLAASVPDALAARDARAEARNDVSYAAEPPAGPGTLLVGDASTAVTGQSVRIRVLRPDGGGDGAGAAPVPPGLRQLPGDGQMALSPALRALLASPEGEVLRARLPYRDVATVGDAGLLGPGELVAYAGDDRLAAGAGGPVRRVASFGDPFQREPLDPVLSLVLAVGVAVLVLPVGVFVATAARFGAERRERRLAAMRLLGLDAAAARRVAAGEGAVAALVGLVVGAVLFAAGRELLRWASVSGLSVFPSDAVPSPPLVLLVVLAVPAVSTAATALSVRGAGVDPLGTARRARSAPRRATWRWALLLTGVLVLAVQAVRLRQVTAQLEPAPVIAGALLVLLGVLAVIPWLVQAAVARLGAGPLPWLMAVRRLQSGGATSGRVAAGTAVGLAGVIALQGLFASLGSDYTTASGQDPARADTVVSVSGAGGGEALAVADDLAALAGTSRVRTLLRATYTPDGSAAGTVGDPLLIGDCAALAEVAVLPDCRDGDVFVTPSDQGDVVGGDLPAAGRDATEVLPGSSGALGEGASAPRWSVPRSATVVDGRADPTGSSASGAVLATPAAVDAASLPQVGLQAFLDAPTRPALVSVVATAQALSPVAVVQRLQASSPSAQFEGVRRGLTAAAVLVLLGVGATLLVSAVEQLRERAAALSALGALGARPRTVALSLLLDAAVPVVVGTVLAASAGSVLGVLLALVTGASPVLVPRAVLTAAGAAVAVLLAVTVLALPALGRAMHPVTGRVE